MKRSTYPLVLPFSFIHGNPWRHCWPASFSDFRLCAPGGKTSRYLWTRFVFSGSSQVSQRSSLHTLGHMGFVRLIEIHGRSSEIIIANVSLCSGVRILDGRLHLYALSGPAKDGHWGWLGRRHENPTAQVVALQDKLSDVAHAFPTETQTGTLQNLRKLLRCTVPLGPTVFPLQPWKILMRHPTFQNEDDLVLDIDLPVREHLPAVYHPLYS